VVATLQVLIFFVFMLAIFGLAVWALIDLLRRPAAAFVSAGKRTKGFWGAIVGVATAVSFASVPFPTGLPQFFTGLKIAAISVVSGAIAGEFLGGGQGFGELIRVAASQLDTPRVFSLIIYLSLLGLFMFGVVSWMQYRFVFWQRSSNTISSRAPR